jgi:hypothetical protein
MSVVQLAEERNVSTFSRRHDVASSCATFDPARAIPNLQSIEVLPALARRERVASEP